MSIYLVDLIKRVPDSVENRVMKVRDQSRSVLQDALRAECRLVMRTNEEGKSNSSWAQVPVYVKPGHPTRLAKIEFFDDFERILLLSRYRRFLELMRDGSGGLKTHPSELLIFNVPEQWSRLTEKSMNEAAEWASFLLEILSQNDPLNTILAVDEDILGVYKINHQPTLFRDEYFANKASIYLYWGVIGLVSEWMGCTVEDLAIVVLTHELAHAYSQLGADIEGRRWDPGDFSKAETGLKEGLAQYYTDRVLRRLEKRYSGALSVYERMLSKQPEPYQTHKPWISTYSPESIRSAMLEIRRWGEGEVAQFNRRLNKLEKRLIPG